MPLWWAINNTKLGERTCAPTQGHDLIGLLHREGGIGLDATIKQPTYENVVGGQAHMYA